jgi:hypothetical protein
MAYSEVKVIDGICGSGKTTKTFDLINELSTPSRYSQRPDPKFIFVTPFLMECHRVAGSIPKDIPVEHADDYEGLDHSGKSEKAEDINLEQRRGEDRSVVFRENKPTDREFILPPKLEGSRLNGIYEAIYNYQDIVITHNAFKRFTKELIDLIASRESYILIVDEAPAVFEIAQPIGKEELTTNDLKNLITYGNVILGDDNLLSWQETEEIQHWDAFALHKKQMEEERLVLYSEEGRLTLFTRQHPQIFKAVTETHVLTYLFNGSICKAYMDLYEIPYQVQHLQRNHGGPVNYRELIQLYNPRAQRAWALGEFSLSSSWYNRNFSEMEFLKTALSNFFNNNRGIESDGRLWTVVQGQNKRNVRALEGAGYVKRFLAVNARATNVYRNVKAVAYLANIFLMPPIKNYFQAQGVEMDQDSYATGEMIQWIFRSAIRDDQPIHAFIPSPRMNRLLGEWMESLEV